MKIDGARRAVYRTDDRRYLIMKKMILLLGLVFTVSGCTYLREAAKQSDYAARQREAPSQRIYKHMLDRDNFFIFGKVIGRASPKPLPLAVAALSDAYRPGEVVDINFVSGVDAYYGLTLPAGDYRLLLLSDLNEDGYFDGSETVGARALSLSDRLYPEKVLGNYDIASEAAFPFTPPDLHIRVPRDEGLKESVVYPRGTIRSLDDPIFSPQMANLGMYEPAAFLEKAPMMFYALEEDLGWKIPVIFVHGIDGSARDFREIVARLDRTLYRPWFFHYPSGNDLGHLGEFFYNLFLSGKVIPLQETPVVIVAHSMGGVVVREAMNRLTGKKGEAKVKRLITIASPLGGHPGVKGAVNAPLVLPSWRNLDPDGPFIKRLHRRPLPDGLDYRLIYTYGNAQTIKLGENSDGVVPLSSQLSPPAQGEAARQYGFNDTHTGILQNGEAIDRILKTIYEVRPVAFPEPHLAELKKGGYNVRLGDGYTAMEKYFIHHLAHYLEALAAGRIEPIHPMQEHFLRVCRGDADPEYEVESAWIKFIRGYPDRSRWMDE
jgi:pimeloyl-ACP methyl ester carboxylesterase